MSMIGLQLASSPGVRRGEPRVPHLRIEYSASLEARATIGERLVTAVKSGAINTAIETVKIIFSL